jgi:hypothetical protein
MAWISVGPIVREIEKFYLVSKRKEISYRPKNRRKANRYGHILRRELASKIRYLRKGRGEDISDEKTSKKRYAAT